MTRTEILAEYVVENGRIRTPGPCLDQKIYVPYFWAKALEGWADWEEEEGDNAVFGFLVMPEDQAEFPELSVGQKVLIEIGAAGFVREVTP